MCQALNPSIYNLNSGCFAMLVQFKCLVLYAVFICILDKATSEYNVSEDWQLIMDLCDRIRSVTTGLDIINFRFHCHKTEKFKVVI